jgi:hypothetical protein
MFFNKYIVVFLPTKNLAITALEGFGGVEGCRCAGAKLSPV